MKLELADEELAGCWRRAIANKQQRRQRSARASRFHLKTAKALGLVPPALQMFADEVIE